MDGRLICWLLNRSMVFHSRRELLERSRKLRSLRCYRWYVPHSLRSHLFTHGLEKSFQPLRILNPPIHHSTRTLLPNHTYTFVQGTKDVRLDPQLNKKVWESGIKGVPYRLRVRISRKRNDEEGAKEKLYSYVQAVNVPSAKGLATAVVED